MFILPFYKSVSQVLEIHCQLQTMFAIKLKQVFQILKVIIKNQTKQDVMEAMVIFQITIKGREDHI